MLDSKKQTLLFSNFVQNRMIFIDIKFRPLTGSVRTSLLQTDYSTLSKITIRNSLEIFVLIYQLYLAALGVFGGQK